MSLTLISKYMDKWQCWKRERKVNEMVLVSMKIVKLRESNLLWRGKERYLITGLKVSKTVA